MGRKYDKKRKHRCCCPYCYHADWDWDGQPPEGDWGEHPGWGEAVAGAGYPGYACYTPIAGVSKGFCIDNGALLIALAIFLCLCGGFGSGLGQLPHVLGDALKGLE